MCKVLFKCLFLQSKVIFTGTCLTTPVSGSHSSDILTLIYFISSVLGHSWSFFTQIIIKSQMCSRKINNFSDSYSQLTRRRVIMGYNGDVYAPLTAVLAAAPTLIRSLSSQSLHSVLEKLIFDAWDFVCLNFACLILNGDRNCLL